MYAGLPNAQDMYTVEKASFGLIYNQVFEVDIQITSLAGRPCCIDTNPTLLRLILSLKRPSNFPQRLVSLHMIHPEAASPRFPGNFQCRSAPL